MTSYSRNRSRRLSFKSLLRKGIDRHMKRRRDNKRNVIFMFIVLAVLLCGTVAASFFVSHNIKDKLRESAYDSLMDASEIIRQNIDSDFQDDIDLLSSFGEMLHGLDSRQLSAELAEICGVMGLLNAWYVDDRGRGVSRDGASFTADSLPVEETALSGAASVSIGFVGQTGQQHLILQTPIFADGQVAGALYGEVVATRYYSEDTFVFRGGEGRASLFNRADGAFVIKAPQTELTYLKSNSIFDAIRQSGNDEATYNTFVEKTASGAKSIISLRYDSVNSYVAILPCKTNGELYIATIISGQALQTQADTISRLILIMQIILIIGLCGLIVLGSLLLYRMMKEEQLRRTRELEERSREELSAALVRAQEANVAKTRFLSNMSHDIRTPMNAIIGMTALAGQNLGDKEKLRDCLSVVSSSSHHLLDLINDILDMSRIESGNITFLREPFALPVAVSSVASIISPLCRGKGQDFSVKFVDVEHEYLIGDKTKVNQVLMNLLNNANKFTPEGGRIRLCIQELPSPGQDMAAYRFSVADNGIGIAREEQEAVFEAFFRAGDSVSGKVEGTGLGLPIAKSIVLAMGGSIELESQPGQGSVFTVTLSFPLREEPDFTRDCPELRGKGLLAVGDDHSLCAKICAYGAEAGMNVASIVPGPFTAERLRDLPQDLCHPDLAVVDWYMEGSGEAMSLVRRIWGAEIQLIALVGQDPWDVEASVHAAGANAILTRPLFRSRLYEEAAISVRNESLYNKPQPTLAERRILLVEDNEVNQQVAKRLLESVGALVDMAGHGREGVEAFLASPPGYYDAILMDIQMPVMDGYEATALIRGSEHPDAASIPIVALTANAFTEDDERAARAGMNAHLTKPIEPQAIFNTLKRLSPK